MKAHNSNEKTVSRDTCPKRKVIITRNCSQRTMDNVEGDIIEVLLKRN